MRYKRPDKKNALSLVEAADRDMKYTLTLEVKEDSAPTIARNIYESFLKLGEALLVLRGIQSTDHVLPIKELLKLKVQTKRPINLIDNLRRLRHNINYKGYLPSIAEVEDAVSIAKTCFGPLRDVIMKEIE